MRLSESNLPIYAAKWYDNPQCLDAEEFYSDLAILLHLKKLFTKYHNNKVLRERLILNHMISFLNVFNAPGALKILFFKIDATYHPYLKSFLVYMNRCPDTIELNGTILDLRRIPEDINILQKLKCDKK
jgi:hypothetical protein